MIPEHVKEKAEAHYPFKDLRESAAGVIHCAQQRAYLKCYEDMRELEEGLERILCRHGPVSPKEWRTFSRTDMAEYAGKVLEKWRKDPGSDTLTP